MSKSRFKFELNKAGVAELLKSPEMKGILESAASRKAGQAGAGYTSEVHTGKKRIYANVFPDTAEAAKDNYKNNTLEKVIRS